MHGPAAKHGEAIAAEIDHIEVRGACRNPFFQQTRALVDQRQHATRNDFLIAERTRAHAQLAAVRFDQGRHLGIGNRVTPARFVAIPALADLLAEAAEFTQTIGQLGIEHLRPLDVAPLADRPTDVIAGQIADTERPHRHAETLHRLVDLLRARALLQQKQRLAHIGFEHAIADETVTDTGDHGGLADLLAQCHDRGQGVLGGGLAAHHFEQLHHIGRREEVRAQHIGRPLGESGNPVHIQRGGVRSQNRTGFGDRIERLEHLLLDPDLLEHRFDDQIAVRQRLHRQGRREQGHACIELVLAEFALLQRALVVAAQGGDAAVQRLLLLLDDGDGNAGVEKIHADAAAHGAGADHAHLVDAAQRRIGRHIRNLAGRAFAEEHVTQRLGFLAVHQQGELLSLETQAFVERLAGRRGHAFQAGHRRWKRTGHGAHIESGDIEKGLGVGVLELAVAHQHRHLAGGETVRDQLAGGRHRAGFDHGVEQLGLRQFGGRRRRTGNDHVQGQFEPDHARQSLRTTTTRKQAQLHFRQRDQRAAGGHAVVTGQRQFQAAAHRGAFDRGDDGFGGSLDCRDEVVQARRRLHFRRVELANVRSARKMTTAAGDHDGLDLGVGQRTVQSLHQARSYRLGQAVHRRVLHDEDGAWPLGTVVNCGHARSSQKSEILAPRAFGDGRGFGKDLACFAMRNTVSFLWGPMLSSPLTDVKKRGTPGSVTTTGWRIGHDNSGCLR